MSREKVINTLRLIVATILVTFHIYTALFGSIPGNGQRSIHLSIMLCFVGLTLLLKDEKSVFFNTLNVIFIVLGVGAAMYVFYITPDYDLRGGRIYTYEIAVGCCLILSVLYFAWRRMGKALPLVAMISIVTSPVRSTVRARLETPFRRLQSTTRWG